MGKSLLYTRGGDTGYTSLVGGERVKKNSSRLCAYGTIDELSSALGLIVAGNRCGEDLSKLVYEIQNELFNIGSYLATINTVGSEKPCSSLSENEIEWIEKQIDRIDGETPPIREFILPGGCEAAALAHMARVICRRAERCILDLSDTEYVDPNVIRYVNRLSDLLFAMARNLNHGQGYKEITWKKKNIK